MIYIYDARYNLKTPTTYEKLSGITGSSINVLRSIKSKKIKIPRLEHNYIIDDKTTKKQLRTWYENVKFKNEVWKYIDEVYKISNYGRVKKIYEKYPDGKFMMPYPKKRSGNKLQVKIYGKEIFIHKLVAEAFLDNPNNYGGVYHKNGILHDNYHGNLEYVSKSKLGKIGSSKQNNRPSIIAKDAYTGEIIDWFKSSREVEKVLYTNRQSVLDCLNGKIEKTMHGYKFEYEEVI